MPEIIMTVAGPVEPGQLGLTLPHEHIMSTFGADPARYPEYPVDRLLEQVLPYLARIRALGVRTIADCTTAYFGRHPELLRRISIESGMLLLTNTGYYAARRHRYVPAHAFEETAEQIAARWIREWTEGIDETGIRPGFIKTAMEAEPFTEMEMKLIQAAALTHLHTGLAIQTHLGDYPEAANWILDVLEKMGAPASSWIWVHAHRVSEIDPILEAAGRGAYISFDGISEESCTDILIKVQTLQARGFLKQVLLSHDGDSYTIDGGLRPYEYLLTNFIPLLKQNGFSQGEIDQMTIANPAAVFSVAR